MALPISRLISFATGGFEEVPVLEGSPTIVTTPVDKTKYAMQGAGSAAIATGSLGASGNFFMVSAKLRLGSLNNTFDWHLRPVNVITFRHCSVSFNAQGSVANCVLRNSINTQVASAASIIPLNTYVHVVFYVNMSNSGVAKVWINGTLFLSATSDFLNESDTSSELWLDSGGTTVHTAEIAYGTSATDFESSIVKEGYHVYEVGVAGSGYSTFGNAPNSGAWGNTGEQPLSEATFVEYINNPDNGHAATNGTLLAGPNGLGIPMPADPWVPSSARYNGPHNEKSVVSQDGAAQSIRFKPDGLKMYVLGASNNRIYEYDLSTAWDVSTATYSTGEDYVLGGGTFFDFFFKSDGTRMFVLSLSIINEYDLSTAWDVSTATFNGTGERLDIATGAAVSHGMFFKPDGTRLFLTGAITGDINEYDLSVAWDVSTGTYNGTAQDLSVSGQDLTPEKVAFSSDGLKAIILGSTNDSTYSYNLGTAWDVSTGSYAGAAFAKDVSGQELVPTGMTFSADGSRMYIVGTNGDAIVEYDLIEEYIISGEWFVWAKRGNGGGTTHAVRYGKVYSDGTNTNFVGGAVSLTTTYSPYIILNTDKELLPFPDEWALLGLQITGAQDMLIAGGFVKLLVKAAAASIVLVVNDISHSVAADNLALTQQNTLAMQESLHNVTADNIALSQHYTLTVQESSHTLTSDNVIVTVEILLVVAETLHSQTADNIALIQQNILAIQEALHNNLADNIDLVQQNILAINPADHTIIVDNIALLQQNVLAIQDIAHSVIVDNINLTNISLLINEITHSVLADNINLIQQNTLAIDSTLHSNTVDNLTLLQQHILAVQDILHSVTAESPALDVSSTLVIQDAVQTITIDNISLIQQNLLAIQEILHTITTDNLVLVQQNTLAVNEAAQTLSSDNIVLSTESLLVVQEILQSILVDTPTLVQQNTLSMQEILQTITVDNLDLVQQNTLALADTAHSLTSDNIELSQAIQLIVQDATQNIFIDNLNLIQQHTLAIQDTLHTILTDSPTLTQQNTLTINEVNVTQLVDNIVLEVAGVLGVNSITHAITVDSLNLIQQNILAISEAFSSLTSENVVLIPGITLTPAEVLQTISIDNIDLVQQNALAIFSCLQSITIENVVLLQQNILQIAEVAHTVTIDNLDLSQQNILQVQEALHTLTSPNLKIGHNDVILVVNSTLHSIISDNLTLFPGTIPVPTPDGIIYMLDGAKTILILDGTSNILNVTK